MKNLPASFLAWLLTVSSLPAAQPAWVHYDNTHTLVYSNDNMGNHLPDFSFAGYEGGGVAMPTNIVVKTNLTVIAGDNTAHIQAAINYVSGLTPDANGFRGVVLLAAGVYQIAGTLTISSGGVILRGSGNNTNTGTILLVTGNARNVLTVTGSGSWSKTGSTFTNIDNYVPLGATNFHVSGSPGFAAGSTIVIQRPWTQPWINAIGMSNYWSPATGLEFERQVVAVSGNQVTIDAPLCNPLESQWTTGLVYQVTDPGRIQQAGVENLCAVGQIADYPSNILTGVFANFTDLKNCWARDILLSGWGNGITFGGGTKWCTAQDCQYVNPGTGTSSAAPAAWTISGAQCLFQRCTSDGGYYHIMVTQDSTPGPNVFLNFTCSGTHYNGGPHQRWAAGVLHDDIVMAADSQGGYTPYLAINNRGSDGSGQGWAAGFSLMYDCQVPQFQLEQPAVTNHYNWTIGGAGSVQAYSDSGVYDALGTIVNPRSLYLEQLRERLGGAAIENIGYQLFTISNSPAARVITAGASTTFTVTVGDPTLMSNIVALSVSGLPANASASFNTNSVTGAGNATLTVVASNSIALGSYLLNIIGANAGLTHTNSVTLTVGNFGLVASPAAQTVFAGPTNVTYTVTVGTNSGFSGTVAFGVSGLPANAGAIFNPGSLNGAGASMLSVTISNNTPPGSYTLAVTGTNGSAVAGATAGLTIVNVPAGVLTWNGGSATDNNWSDPANWSNTGIASNAFLFFDGTTRLNNTNDTAAGTAYSNLVFNAGAGAFVLNGNPITLVGNITNNSASPQTINLGLIFGSSFTLSGAGDTLIMSGGLTNTLGASGFTTLTLTGSGLLANILNSVNSPGGTNIIAESDPNGNWTLMDNAASTPMTVPWVFSINSGTFNFGSASSAPTLTTTTPNNSPSDNQAGTVAGAVGTFNLLGGTLTTSARLNTATALNSTGIVNQAGGTFNIGSQFQGANGGNAGEVSLVNVSGGTMNIAGGGGPFYVASRGGGTLNVSNAAVLNCGTLDVSRNADGNNFGSVGVVNFNGGTILANKVGTATANAETGTSANPTPSATFNFNGGTLKINSSTSPFFQGSTVAPIIPITAVVRSGGAILDSNGKTNIFAESLQHDGSLGSTPDGGLTKNGLGSLILVSNVTYTGGTTVNAGALALSNSVALNTSPVLTIAAGATLDASGRSDGTLTLTNGQKLTGNGTVKGNAVVGSGATLAPGNSIGTLLFANNLTLNGGSTTVMAINKSVTPSNAVAQVVGNVFYGGTLIVTNLGPNPFAAGDSFKLFNAAAYSGGFMNLVPVIPAVNLAWNTNSLAGGILSIVSAPTPPPRFGAVKVSGSNLVFSATNGVPDWPCYVLATTNLALPLAQWPVLATNQFDAGGNLRLTNTVNASVPETFYLLKLQ